jgi:RNA polymerase sigma-70 factor, ECF subfamily
MLRRDPFYDTQSLIRAVYAYVAYRIGDGADAEDVTSETFERALRYRKTYDARKGEPIAWLIGIARRCLSDAVSSRTAAYDPAPAAGRDLEHDTIQRLTLRTAVAGLDESNRELIALRYGAGLTARQIAGLTGRSTNAVEVALHRALARLRQTLDDEQADTQVRESAL